ncbi:hypothetical protein D3C72_2332860 [compost metagenome]
MRFSYFYVNGRFTLYDIALETVGGHHVYVASLSENPAVRFIAVRPEAAVEQLKAFVKQAASAPQPSWRRPPSGPSQPGIRRV